MIAFDLPFPVSTNALFYNRRKGAVGRNGKKLRGRGITDEYKAWKTEAGWEIKRQKPRPIDGPVRLNYTFADGHEADLGNLEKGVTDLLVTHGLIDDDGPEVVREIRMAFGDVVGVRVEVTPIC